jgi:hypothetical protein
MMQVDASGRTNPLPQARNVLNPRGISTVRFQSTDPIALTMLLRRYGYVLHDPAEPGEWIRLAKGPLCIAVHHDGQAIGEAPDANGAIELLSLCWEVAAPNGGKIHE